MLREFIIDTSNILEEYKDFNLSSDDLYTLRCLIIKEKKYIINPDAIKIIEDHNLQNHPLKLERLLDLIIKNVMRYYPDIYSKNILDQFLYEKVSTFIVAKYSNDLSSIEKFKALDKFFSRYQFDFKFEYLFELMFNEKERSNSELTNYIISNHNRYVGRMLKYLTPDDRALFIKNNYVKAYNFCRPYLTPKELDYVAKKIRENDEVFLAKDQHYYASEIEALMIYWRCDLLKKLKKTYGKSYEKITGKFVTDDEEFVYAVLNSNVLEQIYTSPIFTVNDTSIIVTLIQHYKEKGKKVDKLEEKNRIIREKISKKEKDLYSFIVSNKDNTEILDKYLKENSITRDNYIKYITSRKCLSKPSKEGLLLILSKHFNTNYLSVFDILDIIDEAKERGVSKYIILQERNIDTVYFDKVYKSLKIQQPEIYELLQGSRKRKSYKSLLKLYYTIIKENITNYDSFIKRYKQTPEELLESFSDTPLFSKIHEHLLTWYDFQKGLPDIKNKQKNDKK